MAIFGHDPNLDPAAREQFVQPAIALPVQQRLDLGRRFVPPLLERRLPGVFGDEDVGGVELAVADDLHLRDSRNLLADELEDRAAEVAGDAAIRTRVLQLLVEEGVVEPLAAGGEAAELGHGAAPSPFTAR